MITIGIQFPEGWAAGHEKMSFETRRSVPLRRVFLDYCDRLGLVYGTVHFVSGEAEKINENQTAEECDIEDGDVIKVYYVAYGGR